MAAVRHGVRGRGTGLICVLVLLVVAAVPLARGAAEALAGDQALAPTTGSISGTVTDAAGVPVPGVTVSGAYGTSTSPVVTTTPATTSGGPTTAPTSAPGTSVPAPPPLLSATTDLRGRYTITGVNPGSQYLTFKPPAGSPFAAQPYTAGLPPQPYQSSAPVTVVAGQDTSGIDAALAPGGTIAGVTTSMTGAPLGAITVCLEQQSPSSYQTCAATGADGAYRFESMFTGFYKVSFRPQSQTSPPQPGQYLSQYFDGQPTGATAAVLNLTAGQVLSGVNARMAQPCSVFGAACEQVTNANGCLTAVYTAPRTAVLRSCSPATSTQWTDTAGHNVVGNPVTLTYAGSGPWTVTASTNSGSSVFTDTITIQFPASVGLPGAPTRLEAIPRDGAVQVSWVAPSSDGNAPVTGYTVTASPGGHTCSWSDGPRSCTVPGLTNGTPYTFTARATNAVGTGGPSAPSLPVAPATTPAPPGTVNAVAGDGNALVSWSSSPSTGGAPIVGYVVLASPGGKTCAAAVGSACSVDGLTNGVATTFTVRAVNAMGTGAPSAPTAPVTPLGRPSAPLAVSGTPGDTQVQVSWSAPANNGGSGISSYTVTALPGPGTCTTGGALTCTVGGLTNGVPYSFTVVATNAAGTGPVSDASPAIVPGSPGQPTAVTAQAGKQQATVSWTAPALAGSSPIIGYVVESAPYGATCSTAQLTCTLTGLTAGQVYTFRVYALNALGAGQPSAPSSAVTPWSGSGYHPVVPSRILDSRGSTGGWNAKLVAGASRSLKVTDLGGASSVPSTASAVVMNVTATGSTAGSFVTVWPTGAPQPNASNLNFAPGETIPNLVTVKIGPGGLVQFATAAGAVDMIADVVGYYDDGNVAGNLFTAMAPVRMLDSRTATGGWNGKLVAGAPRDLAVRTPQSANGVPATATAVIANVTVTGGTTGSYLSVWPSGVQQPVASNLNFGAGQTISNLVIVQIGANGALRFDNAVGGVDVIVDVVGYFDPTGGSRFHSLDPTRFLDSRIGLGSYGAWGPNEARWIYLGSYGSGVVPAAATAVVTNLTATNGSLGSFLTAYPAGSATPIASNVNFAPGQTIPNLATVKIGVSGAIAIYNNQGTVQVIGDAVGYYSDV